MVKLLNNNRGRSIAILLFFFAMSAVLNVAYAATIKVTPDRDVVSMNESFTLFFQAAGSVDGDPDFSPLEKDFSIVSKQKRSNLSIINGKRTSSNEWLVEVMPKREGVIEIPSIKFGKDRSPVTQVTVKNSPLNSAQDHADDEIFIEVEATPQDSWVQGQIIYTIRLFRSVNTFNSSLSEPRISEGKMIAEKLEDRQFETSRHNKRYMVLQRRYALFPQASGKFTLEPIVFTGQVSQQSRHLFDPFGRNSKTIQRLSRSIDLNIKPIPADYKGKTWLPAKKILIEEKWATDPDKLIAGEPVTRTIVIKANGLSAEQLPEIGVSELENFKLYPDQADIHNQTGRDGVLGIRQEKSALIPKKAGEFVLPAIELTWWNTQTGKMETAQLPERVINVLPGSSKESSDESEVVLNEKPSTEVVRNENTETEHSVTNQTNYWIWVSLLLALGWLTSALFWWKQNKTTQDETETGSNIRLNERHTLKALRETIRKEDPVAIKNALLIWGRSIWKENPPASLAELGQRCGSPLSEELELLNRNLYSNSEEHWDRERILLAVENFDSLNMQVEKQANEPNLVPLHRI